jgi:hypothetical protein
MNGMTPTRLPYLAAISRDSDVLILQQMNNKKRSLVRAVRDEAHFEDHVHIIASKQRTGPAGEVEGTKRKRTAEIL